MARSLISIATILVLANVVLSSPALPTYDVQAIGKQPLVLTEVDSSFDDQTGNLATLFIGDLTVGSRRIIENKYQSTYQLKNSGSTVFNGELTLTVSKGIFHYLSIQNEANSYLVACDTPYTLGGSTVASVNIRVLPNSISTYTVYAGTH